MDRKPAPGEKASRERRRNDELLTRARVRTRAELARYGSATHPGATLAVPVAVGILSEADLASLLDGAGLLDYGGGAEAHHCPSHERQVTYRRC